MARSRMDAARKSGEWREAWAELLQAERELAASRNEEHAVPLEFPVRWDIGAPLPHLLVNDTHALLMFLVGSIDPAWDGTRVTAKDAASTGAEALALVEFKRCVSAKLGSPNDEVFKGHRLAGKGLEAYSAQVVRNSKWLAEIEENNRVHTGYRPEAWRRLTHYVFWFHDDTFECIAESFSLEVHTCSFPDLLAEGCRRLVS